MARRHASAMPRTGAPAMIGETPTTGADAVDKASRMPGTDRMVPMLTTGLDGGSSTTSAAASASITPGAGLAVSAPTETNRSAATAARIASHHSWKWTARRPSASEITTWVSTRSSLIGSSRTRGCHRSHSAAVTSESA